MAVALWFILYVAVLEVLLHILFVVFKALGKEGATLKKPRWIKPPIVWVCWLAYIVVIVISAIVVLTGYPYETFRRVLFFFGQVPVVIVAGYIIGKNHGGGMYDMHKRID